MRLRCLLDLRLPPIAALGKLANPALVRLLDRHALGLSLALPPAHLIRDIRPQHAVVVHERLDAQYRAVDLVSIFDLQHLADAAAALRHGALKLVDHERPESGERVVVQEDLHGVLARVREVLAVGGVGGGVVEDFVQAADLGDEGVGEGGGGVKFVAVEEYIRVDVVGGEVGEEVAVEHELHEGWAEGGAFGDGIRAAGFDVC